MNKPDPCDICRLPSEADIEGAEYSKACNSLGPIHAVCGCREGTHVYNSDTPQAKLMLGMNADGCLNVLNVDGSGNLTVAPGEPGPSEVTVLNFPAGFDVTVLNEVTVNGSVSVDNFPTEFEVTVLNFPSTQVVSGIVEVNNFPTEFDVNIIGVNRGVEFCTKPAPREDTPTNVLLEVDDTGASLTPANPTRTRITVTNNGPDNIFVSLNGGAGHILFFGGSWTIEGFTGTVDAVAAPGGASLVAVTDW